MKDMAEPRTNQRRQTDEHIERLIDEALEESFPASDPPAPAVDVRIIAKLKKPSAFQL